MTNKNLKIKPDFRNSDQKFAFKKAFVIWIFGLPSSGKTTLTSAISKKLTELNILNTVLDGDELRQGINCDLHFSDLDRMENIRRAAHIAKLFTDNGFITICSFITPKIDLLNLAKSIVGSNLFFDIFLECPVEICMGRDIKGLYKKAQQGLIKNFTGLDGHFEQPIRPWLTIRSFDAAADECANEIFNEIFSDIHPVDRH